MNDDLLIARLRDLPPDLAAPGDRMARVRRRVGHRRRVRAGVAALAVAVLAGGLAAGFANLRGGVVTPISPASCPADPGDGTGRSRTVPAPPGVDTGGHLVPRQAPARAVVCRYQLRSYDPAKGEVRSWDLRAGTLTGGLDRLGEDLWSFPRAPGGWQPVCPLTGILNPVDYLVALQYPGGTVWVSTAAPGQCEPTTNGDFVSDRSAGAQVERSLAAGAWVPSAAPAKPGGSSPCDVGPEPGRFGQDAVLVPPAPVELQVCLRTDGPAGRARYRTGTLRTGVAEFAAELSSGRTEAGNRGCHAPGGDVTASYELLFRYADGPPVRVQALIGCDPPLLGATLMAWEAPGTDLAARLAAIVAAG
jgi:hypothetical protein